jgi:hypothetical protein
MLLRRHQLVVEQVALPVVEEVEDSVVAIVVEVVGQSVILKMVETADLI